MGLVESRALVQQRGLRGLGFVVVVEGGMSTILKSVFVWFAADVYWFGLLVYEWGKELRAFSQGWSVGGCGYVFGLDARVFYRDNQLCKFQS